ncbi:hypothetical protein HPT25_07260 [Bacillus sp. BRMEA1]|uniref:hypothetical protein n=1 Tax=Neobacillus endophyticus TaxID=2738405 RepID=UPI001563C3CA|nr:hypothetical protein [Neobacillus endophyticus]NRD77295.1 hypothetical protein [Neobacillus endophyticus]
MRRYLGIVSIVILIVTYLILQSLVGKKTGNFWILITFIGYLSSVLSSWYSTSGFWKMASATILILIPAGYLVVFILFLVGVSTGSGF